MSHLFVIVYGKYIHNMVEVVIIGGGIAGCYTAFRLRQTQPFVRVLIIEACPNLGGRTQTDTFSGASVVKGAGVGRLKKDRLLQTLLQTLKFPVRVFPAGHHLPGCEPLPAFVQAHFLRLRLAFAEAQSGPDTWVPVTFKQFAKARMASRTYKRFIATSGFSDYEQQDAADVFTLYGFEDNYRSWSAFGVPWSQLITAMTRDTPYVTNTRVTNVDVSHSGRGSVVTCSGGAVIRCRHVVFATNSSALRTLLPAYSSVYRHIHGQPFLLIYGAFSPTSASTMSAAVCSEGSTVLFRIPRCRK